jgi:cell division protein FtsB
MGEKRTEAGAESAAKPAAKAAKPTAKSAAKQAAKPKPKPAAQESRLGLVPPSRTAPLPRTAPAPATAAGTSTRPRAPRPPVRPPRPRFRLTRRATILVLALCAVVVTIAYPLQEYLAQKSQLNAVNQQNDSLTRQVDQIQQQISLWRDPGYVAIQARAQLHYVKPGEEGFTLPGTALGNEQLGMPTPTASPWYDTLWGSVKSPSASTTAPSAPSGR